MAIVKFRHYSLTFKNLPPDRGFRETAEPLRQHAVN